METEYRLYTFTNMYLSPIQRGIQSAHLVHELFTKYPRPIELTTDWTEYDTLNEWARLHMTMIVLNGGYSSELAEIYGTLVEHSDLGLPFGKFYEPGIDGALTCVGVVLPSDIYDYQADFPEDVIDMDMPDYVTDLYDLVKRYPLA